MGALLMDENAKLAVGAQRDAATQLRQSSRTGPPVGPFEPADGIGEPGIRTMSPRCHRAGHDQCSRRVLPLCSALVFLRRLRPALRVVCGPTHSLRSSRILQPPRGGVV